MNRETAYVAFCRARQVAAGTLQSVLPALKQRFDKDSSELVLVFEVDSGRQVDFDLRGSVDEIIARAGGDAPRGPGRPKLGVSSREVSLLPRHWDWLEAQSAGISGTLRRLIEGAIKNEPPAARAQQIRAALSRVLMSIAGNRPNFEEATRALFAAEDGRFEGLVEGWPKDIQKFAVERVAEATRIERTKA